MRSSSNGFTNNSKLIRTKLASAASDVASKMPENRFSYGVGPMWRFAFLSGKLEFDFL